MACLVDLEHEAASRQVVYEFDRRVTLVV